MIILVSGSRNYPDKEQAMSVLRDNITQDDTVIHGDCPNSPDIWATDLAIELGATIKAYPADWDTHGRAAGPIRNEQMVKDCEFAVVFWDGKSKGTRNVMKLCAVHSKTHLLVMPDKESK